MNISIDTVKKLKDLGYIVWSDNGSCTMNDMGNYKKGTHLGVGSTKDNPKFICKLLKAPKTKEISVDWVLK